jgi:hypothetical protein
VSATWFRPTETMKSVSVLPIVLSICEIHFEKFHSIEKLINPWSKFISLKVIYSLTLNKFKYNIIIYLTANGLSPSGSGYYTCT